MTDLKPNPALTDPEAVISRAWASISDAGREEERQLSTDLDDILSSNVCIKWHRFDEDDRRTWPPRGQSVLGLICWSRLNTFYGSILAPSASRRPAVFYQAAYGYYGEVDGEVVFVLDHGNQDSDDSDDYVQAPRWWAQIMTPQQLDLE